MSITEATPYLFFNGNASEAIQFYEQALGAKPEGVTRYGDHVESCPEADKQRVMHACLKLGSSNVMLSDAPDSMPASEGSKVEIALNFDDTEQMSRAFQALAESGKVIQELHDAFWGDRFGALQDRYGIHWMFTGPQSKS